MALHTGTPAADGGSVGLHSILTGSVPLVLLSEEASNALFAGSGSIDNMPTVEIGENKNISIVDAIILTGIAPSKGQARTLINQGGISLNDNKISDVNYVLSDTDFKDGYAILKKGKKVFYKLV